MMKIRFIQLYFFYYTARDYYTVVREFPSGKGFCDIAFIPLDKKHPVMIIELKYDKDVSSAIDQIKDKSYSGNLNHYLENLLMVAVSYEKHTCKIEKYEDKA